jgi:hypothetical protein
MKFFQNINELTVLDDSYIIQLLQEFKYLTDEKEKPKDSEARPFAIGDEEAKSY